MKKIKKQHIIPGFVLFLMVMLLGIIIFCSLASILFPIDLGETNLTERML